MMNEQRLTTLIWFILVALTLLGYWVGQQGVSGLMALTLLLGAALIKSQLVISHFMEMSHARTWWRWTPTVWLVVVLFAIAATYHY